MNVSTRDAFMKFSSPEILSEFLHCCANGICREKVLHLNAYDHLNRTELDIVENYVKNYYRKKTENNSYSLLKELPDNVADLINSVYKIRYKDIIDSLVKDKFVATESCKLLESFDWKLKWILGSSTLSTIREPICQIELICLTKSDNLQSCKTSINFECDLEKLDKLIEVLQSFKKESSKVENNYG